MKERNKERKNLGKINKIKNEGKKERKKKGKKEKN